MSNEQHTPQDPVARTINRLTVSKTEALALATEYRNLLISAMYGELTLIEVEDKVDLLDKKAEKKGIAIPKAEA